MLICNKCGKTSKRGKFCVNCGGELTEFFSIKTAETTEKPKGKCPECGKEFTEGKFCVFCGVALDMKESASQVVEETASPVIEETASPVIEEAPKKLRCTKCGKIHDKGKFCTVCGAFLQPVEDTPVQTTQAVSSAAVSPETPQPTPVVSSAEPQPEQTTVPEKLKCVACGKLHDKGKFCTSCGGKLVPESEASAPAQSEASAPAAAPIPAPSAPAAETKLKCSVCGKEHDKGKFCTVCGGKLIPANEPVQAEAPAAQPATGGMLKCADCGKIMEKGKFCTVCGGNLVPVTDSPAPAFAAATPAPSVIPQPANNIPQPTNTIPQPTNTIPQPTNTIPQPANTAPAGGLVCPKCGKTFDHGKFCTVCGENLVPQNSAPAAQPVNDGMLHCVQCGAVYEKGKFCVSCGGQLVTSDKLNV